jgi:hypothetical protein
MQSGLPFTMSSGVDNARTGTGGQRADLAGDPHLPDGRSTAEQIALWFNTAAFGPNAVGTFGNTGRNAFRGPGYRALDLGLHKTFDGRGTTRIQVRIEAFNVLNHVNFDLPNSSQNSANFGKILNAGDPRIMQLALRVSF